MAVTCDNCGTDRNVRRAFITVWNGNVFDLCKACAKPLGVLIDAIWFTNGAGQPPEDAKP